MPIPVLIAARNEASHIERTLKALPRNVEPIVIPNDCKDNTVEVIERIADDYGVKVLHDSPAGKLPALQFGVRKLGQRAIDPFITLDADAYPIFRNKWVDRMVQARKGVDPSRGAVVVGPSLYVHDIDPVSALWHNLGTWKALFKYKNDPNHGANGRNMLIDLKNKNNLHYFLTLPHKWPREDALIKDKILEHGGSFVKITHPHAIVATSGERYPGIITRLRAGKIAAGEMVKQSYLEEKVEGSSPYIETHYRTQNEGATFLKENTAE